MLQQTDMTINSSADSLDLITADQGVKFFYSYTTEHAVIGISPFNSFFSLDQIVKIISVCQNIFSSLSVYVPTEISQYTLQAKGYDTIASQRKTKRQDNYTINKVKRALAVFGLKDDILLTTEKLKNDSSYCALIDQFLKLFNEDPFFHSDCLSASKWILHNMKLSEEQSCIAAKYFLYELPLLFNSPAVVKKKSSAFVYHFLPEPLKKFYEKYQDQYACKTQAFAIAPL